jgi:hypothetical protein
MPHDVHLAMHHFLATVFVHVPHSDSSGSDLTSIFGALSKGLLVLVLVLVLVAGAGANNVGANNVGAQYWYWCWQCW